MRRLPAFAAEITIASTAAVISAIAGAGTVWMGTTAALAASVMQPGGTVGAPFGAPLAEGVYFVDTSSYGERSATRSGFGVNLTYVLWATPFSFYDTRLQLFFLQPTNYTTKTGNDAFYPNSTFVAGQFAHAFGNGFNASYMAGYRAAMPTTAAFRLPSFEQRGAVTYNANGFNLTANAINGLFYDRSTYPDWFNLDLTATKKFGKFEAGVVAFGSSDLSRPFAAYRRQRQIAVGGLIGYKFETFTVQTYVTRDVYQRNYPGYDTRGFLRLIVPLYLAPAALIEPIRARF